MYIMIATLVMVSLIPAASTCPNMCSCKQKSQLETQRVVNCARKRLDSLPAEIDSNTTKLNLSRNRLTSKVLYQVEMFKDLIYLDLSYNEITVIHDYQFSRSIKHLYLDHNRIYFSGNDPFGGMEWSLVDLSLSHNHIHSEISTVTFFLHQELRHLDLSENAIPALANNSVFPASLWTLNLSNNPVRRLHLDSFSETVNLKSLDIHGINMKTIKSRYFTECHQLTRLRIGGKHLTEISSQTFRGLTRLEELEITNTKIAMLPTGVFEDLEKLTKVDISMNELDFIEKGVFNNDSGITELRMDRNGGKLRLDDHFRRLRNLKYLSLRENNLTSFPSHFSTLHSLAILDLSMNALEVLKTEDTFNSLLALNVSHNYISHIDAEFFESLPSLTSVDLSENNLTELRLRWWRSNITEIMTSGNQWSCDCEMKAMYMNTNISLPCLAGALYRSDYEQNVSGGREFCVICASPTQYQGDLFSELNLGLLNCSGEVARKTDGTDMTIYVAAAATGFSLIILAVAGIITVTKGKRGKKEKPSTILNVAGTPTKNPRPGLAPLPTNSSASQLIIEEACYQEIPESSEGYTFADNRFAHEYEYCGLAMPSGQSKNTASQAKHDNNTKSSESTHNVYINSSGTSDNISKSKKANVYVTANQASESMIQLALKKAEVKGSNPYALVPDISAYHGLPAPPLPPTGDGSLAVPHEAASLQSDSDYELDQGGKRKSYMDFRDPASVGKRMDIVNIENNSNRDEQLGVNHAYELD